MPGPSQLFPLARKAIRLCAPFLFLPLILPIGWMGCKRKAPPPPPPPRFYLMEAPLGVLVGGRRLRQGEELPSGVSFSVEVGGRVAVSTTTGEMLLLLYGPGEAQLYGERGRYVVHWQSGQGAFTTAPGVTGAITTTTAQLEFTGPTFLYAESRPHDSYLCLCEGKARISPQHGAPLSLTTPPEHQGWWISEGKLEPLTTPLRHTSREKEELAYLLKLSQIALSRRSPSP